MSLILRICILVASFLFAFSPATLWGKEIRTVRVAAFNFYPAIFLDTDNQVRGFHVDMLDELAAREQIRFEYVFGSWNDGLERLRSGEVDLVPSAAYTEERSTFMDFGKQVLLTVWGEFYTHKDSPIVPLRDLQDENIAVVRGDHNAHSFREHLGKFGISSQFIEFADFEEVFEAVKERRVIGGVVNSVFGDAAAKKYEVQSSGIVFNPFDIYFAAAKGQNADLLMLLDDYLLDWRHDSSSIYYQSRLKWWAVHEHEEFIQDWIIKLAVGAVLLVLIGLVFIVLLRSRVSTATRQLQDSNNLIHLLLDSTAEAIYGLDPHGICTFCNAACVRILGYENASLLIGKNMHDLIHPSHAVGRGRPDNECNLLKELNKRTHSDNEVFWRADGSSIPVEYWSYPIRQADKTLGLVISFMDITERKQKEKALRELMELKDQAEALAHLGSWKFDLNTNVLIWSDETYRIFGCEPQSFPVTYEIFLDFVHPADRIAVDNAYSDSLRKESNFFKIEHRIIRKDTGEVRHVHEHGIHERNAAGVIIQSYGMVQDITERKRVEDLLIAKKNAYQSILSAAHDGFFVADINGKILDANHTYLAFSGYSREELLTLHIADLDFHEDPDEVVRHIANLMAEGSDLFESRHRRKDGSLWPVEVSSTYSPLNDGRFFVFVRDITERKKVQEQQLLAQFSIERTSDALFWVDKQGCFKFVNTAACQQLGYSRDELLQMSIADVNPDWPAERWPAHFDQLRLNKQFLFETRHRTRSGNILHVEVSSNYFKMEDSEFNFAFVRDITQRKQSELALKLYHEEMEEFVYSVSHDLKSPLITVQTFLTMLRQDLLGCDQQQINEDINYIDKAAEKMSQLIEALLRYSQVDKIEAPAQTVTVSQQVEECLTALAGVFQKDQVQVTISELPQLLHGNPLHFGQIWQNLIENAVKYMGDQTNPHIEIGTTQQGEDAVFYVRDNGMGIAPEHSGQIFNLFSQLNQSSEGSGLGLALAKKIVSIYQGRIWVESAGKEKGSCFRFTLPDALIQETRHHSSGLEAGINV